MLSSCKNALGTVPPLHRPGPSGPTRDSRTGRGRGTEVFPVARPRRLRYKLMLGLGLVVGSVALLVGGTLLRHPRVHRDGQDDRAEDDRAATRQHPHRDAQGAGPGRTPPTESRLRAVAPVRRACNSASSARRTPQTVADGLDPDGGDQESGLITQLDAELKQLEAAVAEARNRRIARAITRPSRDDNDGPAATTRTPAAAPSTSASPSSTTSRPASASRTRRSARAMWVVGFATGWAVVLVAHPALLLPRLDVRARSGSSRPACTASTAATSTTRSRSAPATNCEELADEFNAMTARLRGHLRRPRPAGERAQPATRPQRADGVASGSSPPASPTRSTTRSPASCSAPRRWNAGCRTCSRDAAARRDAGRRRSARRAT